MKRLPTFPIAVSWALGLAIMAAAPRRSMAQDLVCPVAPIDHGGHHHGWHHHASPAVFPRTYSYQYDLWFNRPRHTRYLGPDGRVFWQTTVRGLPLGTPWPSY
ncbi:MAG TPA: hypothetical protein VGZ22_22765 [Isosphaeraceae bacterium]|nr:hypothetical protein [Isosphaeraceae bacterium]